MKHKIQKPASLFILIFFTLSIVFPPSVQAQFMSTLPAPGTQLALSAPFMPATLRGINLFPEDPLKFDFIIDKGDTNIDGPELELESQKLIKYFLAALTTPEDQMWVNLNPKEKNRIVPESFGRTEMGRDLLAQDYILKQLTASLLSPENEEGRKFWDRIYERIYEEARLSSKMNGEVLPALEEMSEWAGKIWIVPYKAFVHEHENGAFVVESKLKVMLEEEKKIEDRKSKIEKKQRLPAGKAGLASREAEKLNTTRHTLHAGIINEIILPAIEKEINTGRNFANLRQIYNSVILATWYKQALKQSALSQAYADKNKTKGIEIEDKDSHKKIFEMYLETFRKGAANYIKEEYDPQTQEIVPRKYFTGGATAGGTAELVRKNLSDSAMLSPKDKKKVRDQAEAAGERSETVRVALKEHITIHNIVKIMDEALGMLRQHIGLIKDNAHDLGEATTMIRELPGFLLEINGILVGINYGAIVGDEDGFENVVEKIEDIYSSGEIELAANELQSVITSWDGIILPRDRFARTRVSSVIESAEGIFNGVKKFMDPLIDEIKSFDMGGKDRRSRRLVRKNELEEKEKKVKELAKKRAAQEEKSALQKSREEKSELYKILRNADENIKAVEAAIDRLKKLTPEQESIQDINVSINSIAESAGQLIIALSEIEVLPDLDEESKIDEFIRIQSIFSDGVNEIYEIIGFWEGKLLPEGKLYRLSEIIERLDRYANWMKTDILDEANNIFYPKETADSAVSESIDAEKDRAMTTKEAIEEISVHLKRMQDQVYGLAQDRETLLSTSDVDESVKNIKDHYFGFMALLKRIVRNAIDENVTQLFVRGDFFDSAASLIIDDSFIKASGNFNELLNIWNRFDQGYKKKILEEETGDDFFSKDSFFTKLKGAFDIFSMIIKTSLRDSIMMEKIAGDEQRIIEFVDQILDAWEEIGKNRVTRFRQKSTPRGTELKSSQEHEIDTSHVRFTLREAMELLDKMKYFTFSRVEEIHLVTYKITRNDDFAKQIFLLAFLVDQIASDSGETWNNIIDHVKRVLEERYWMRQKGTLLEKFFPKIESFWRMRLVDRFGSTFNFVPKDLDSMSISEAEEEVMITAFRSMAEDFAEIKESYNSLKSVRLNLTQLFYATTKEKILRVLNVIKNVAERPRPEDEKEIVFYDLCNRVLESGDYLQNYTDAIVAINKVVGNEHKMDVRGHSELMGEIRMHIRVLEFIIIHSEVSRYLVEETPTGPEDEQKDNAMATKEGIATLLDKNLKDVRKKINAFDKLKIIPENDEAVNKKLTIFFKSFNKLFSNLRVIAGRFGKKKVSIAKNVRGAANTILENAEFQMAVLELTRINTSWVGREEKQLFTKEDLEKQFGIILAIIKDALEEPLGVEINDKAMVASEMIGQRWQVAKTSVVARQAIERIKAAKPFLKKGIFEIIQSGVARALITNIATGRAQIRTSLNNLFRNYRIPLIGDGFPGYIERDSHGYYYRFRDMDVARLRGANLIASDAKKEDFMMEFIEYLKRRFYEIDPEDPHILPWGLLETGRAIEKIISNIKGLSRDAEFDAFEDIFKIINHELRVASYSDHVILQNTLDVAAAIVNACFMYRFKAKIYGIEEQFKITIRGVSWFGVKIASIDSNGKVQPVEVNRKKFASAFEGFLNRKYAGEELDREIFQGRDVTETLHIFRSVVGLEDETVDRALMGDDIARHMRGLLESVVEDHERLKEFKKRKDDISESYKIMERIPEYVFKVFLNMAELSGKRFVAIARNREENKSWNQLYSSKEKVYEKAGILIITSRLQELRDKWRDKEDKRDRWEVLPEALSELKAIVDEIKENILEPLYRDYPIPEGRTDDKTMTASESVSRVRRSENDLGGIDMNPNTIGINTTGTTGLSVSPELFNAKNLVLGEIGGLVPVILNISPVENLPLMLGLN